VCHGSTAPWLHRLVEPCPILRRARSLKIFEAPQIAPTDVMFARSGHVARNRSAAFI